jgi:hypothetical protein
LLVKSCGVRTSIATITTAAKVYFSPSRSVREVRDSIALKARIDPLKEFGGAAREQVGRFESRSTTKSPVRLPPTAARRYTWHGRSNMTHQDKRLPWRSELIMSQRSFQCPKTTRTLDPKPRRTL